MAERDPFGRLPDENPLAGLGSLSEGDVQAAPQPVVSARPVAQARTAAQSPSEQLHSRVGQRVVVAIASVAAGVFTSDAIRDKISSELPNVELPSTEFGSEGAAPDPVGLGEGSLLAQRNLGPALRRVRRSGLGRLKSPS